MASYDVNLSKEAQDKINQAKQSWLTAQAAGDTAGMQTAHDAAESIRSSYGYSGGASGEEYLPIGADPNKITANTYTPATPTTTPTAASTDSGYDPEIQNMINELKAAQKANRIAGLQSAMNSSLSSLDTEQAGLKDTYYNARNQAGGNADVGQYNFAQYMASRGLKGAAAGMPELYRNVGLQNTLGSLSQQEAAANTDIDNRRSNIKTNYETDVAAANADIDSQALETYINQANADREYLANQTATQKQEFQNLIDQGAYSNDYKAQINILQDDGDTSNDWQIPYLQAARNKKLQTNAANQAAAEEKAAAQQTAAAQAETENALNLFKTTGVATQQIASILGIPVGSRTADYDIARIQAAIDSKKADKGSSTVQNTDTYAAIYSAMANSEDPQAWLNQNAQLMTNDEIKYAQSLLK